MRWSVILPLAAVALAGCATDQAGDVERYRALVDLAGAPAEADEMRGRALSLEEAVRLTNAYNERLSIEGERYVQALAERQRRASLLKPTIGLFGDLSLRENTGEARTAAFDAGINAQYDFFTGLTDFRSVESAEFIIRAREWLLLDLREALMLETARAYYEVLVAERQIDVIESSVAVQEERLRDIRGRSDVGFARPLDVALIESQASDTRVQLLDAQNRLAEARSTLVFLTGAEVGESPLTDGFELPQDWRDATIESLLPFAYAHRQDLLAVRNLASAAREIVDAEFGRYFPSISLNLDYFIVRETSPSDLDLASLISANLPIFSAGLIEADVRLAWSVFRQRVLEHSAVRRGIRRDIETIYANFDSSRRRVQELSTQVAAAAESLRQAEAAYAAGLGTNLERIAAQDQLLSAQLRAASEEYIFKGSYLSLLRAAGVLSVDLAGAPLPARREHELEEPESPFVVLPPAARRGGARGRSSEGD